jgi:hypothetical protein
MLHGDISLASRKDYLVMRAGFANLPQHGVSASSWFFRRMALLAGEIVEAVGFQRGTGQRSFSKMAGHGMSDSLPWDEMHDEQEIFWGSGNSAPQVSQGIHSSLEPC